MMFPLFVWTVFSLVILTVAIKLIIFGLGLTMVWINALAIAAGLFLMVIVIAYTNAIID